MRPPFSHDAFLDLFGAYNAALWPAVTALWLATAWLGLLTVRAAAPAPRAMFGLLAIHWAWSGVAYHWLFFRRINPAATLFAGAFIVEAILFAWLATARGQWVARRGFPRAVGTGFLIYGLLYPVLGIASGMEYPRVPLFAVPCPTALVTAGLLLMYAHIPWGVKVIPILWAVVASSAAIFLGVWADLALVVAAVALMADMIRWPELTHPRRLYVR